MNVLITGANGQLGKELVLQLQSYHNVYAFGKEKLDVTDKEQCYQVLINIKPQLIMHCAAYTKVDAAEKNIEEAYSINYRGTQNLADIVAEIGGRFCYISTDYVFDGESRSSYAETDITNPLNIYGKSKRDAEIYVQEKLSKSFIVRTSWLYGLYGHNFVKTMLRMAKESSKIKVVNDQIGSPTYAKDLASFLCKLVLTDKFGLYHASNSGECSWFDFAEAIFEEANITPLLEPCSTQEYSLNALRPKYSVLSNKKLIDAGFSELRPWREGLKSFLTAYKSEGL